MRSENDVLQADFVVEQRSAAALHRPGSPEIALAGRSNVGKSTLLNMLAQRKGLARTSKTPGATRGLLFYSLRLRSGQEFTLVDLPGYGFAARSKTERRTWQSLIETYLESERVAGVVILVDVRRGIESDEEALIEYLSHVGIPHLVAVTKVDRASAAERLATMKAISRRQSTRVIFASGVTGEGRDALFERIGGWLRGARAATAHEVGTKGPNARATGRVPTGDGSGREHPVVGRSPGRSAALGGVGRKQRLGGAVRGGAGRRESGKKR